VQVLLIVSGVNELLV